MLDWLQADLAGWSLLCPSLVITVLITANDHWRARQFISLNKLHAFAWNPHNQVATSQADGRPLAVKWTKRGIRFFSRESLEANNLIKLFYWKCEVVLRMFKSIVLSGRGVRWRSLWSNGLVAIECCTRGWPATLPESCQGPSKEMSFTETTQSKILDLFQNL